MANFPSNHDLPASKRVQRRSLVFLIVLVVAAVGLSLLQSAAPGAAGLLFAVMVGAALVLGVRSASPIVRRKVEAALRSRWGSSIAARVRSAWRGAGALVNRQRGRLIVLTALVAAGTLVMSAVQFQTAHLRTESLDAAFGVMLIGGALVGIPVFLSRKAITLPGAVWLKSLAGTERINRLLLGAGIVCLAILAECNANILHIEAMGDITTDGQFVLLCGGIALVVLGLGGVRFLPRLGRAIIRFLRPPITKKRAALVSPQAAFSVQYLLPIAIVLLAFGLRFWQLNDTNRFFIDELNHVNGILDLFNNPHTGLVLPFSSVAAFPYLFPYGQKIAVEIFGHNYLGLRAFSAVIGTLTVAAVYRLGRALFDRPTALIAALLLATFPPHLQFSRIGLNNIADPLFGTLALAFLASGVRYNRRMDWVIGGAMLGLTHYFYEAGRLLYTPLVIVWLVGVWLLVRSQRRTQKKQEPPPGLPRTQGTSGNRSRGLFYTNGRAAVVALVIVAAPVYFTLIGINRPLTARFVNNDTGLKSDYWTALFRYGDFQDHISTHVVPAFAVYVSEPDITLFYGGHTAMLLIVVVPLFLLGLAILLWRWRSPGAILLLVWVLAAALGNTMMVQSMAYTRFVLVFPALMLVAAVGMRYGVRLIVLRGGQQRWKMLVMVALTVGVAAFQTYYYFAVHIPDFEAQTRADWGHPDADDVLLRSMDFPPGTFLHLVSGVRVDENYYKGVLYFMRPDLYMDTLTPEQLTPDYFRQLPCGTDHAFFLTPNDWDSLWAIQQEFYLRQPTMSPHEDIPPDQQFALYYAPYWPGNNRPFPNRCQPPS